MIIKPENTAIANGVAQGVKIYAKNFTKQASVLDYGAGRLRNSNYLIQQGYTDVNVLDVEAQYKRLGKEVLSQFKGAYTNQFLPNRKFDFIVNNFVLNVIPDIEVRAEIISNIAKLLKDDGKAVFEVRSKEDIFTGKYIEPYLDGFLMGKNTVKTFQKVFEVEELVEILESYGFTVLEKKKLAGSYIIYVGKNVSQVILFSECESVA